VSDIRLDGVTKEFDNGFRAVDDISLTIQSGEFMVLVGPSGCGKSTLLRLIAGLEEASAGTIGLGDRDITELGPRHRDMAMVFQNYALYPHLTVRGNLEYGLRVRKMSKEQRAARVSEVAGFLGLDTMLERKPSALSGGQRQRVAIGRAIVREPQAFLMDEPLSNLDAKLRVAMRGELARLHERLGVTTVYVTHDQVEAMTLGARVAVMRDGRFQQVDRPEALYDEPANLFVAAFMGSPAMNLVEGRVDGESLAIGDLEVPLPPGSVPPVRRAVVGIRPEDFEDAAFGEAELPQVEVEVAVVEKLGSEALVGFAVDAPPVQAEAVRAASDLDEDEATLLSGDHRTRFTARVSPRSRARIGGRLRLTVDPGRFHYFDPESGERLPRAGDRSLAAR